MKPYTIILFDLDDTMIDNRENMKAAFQKMLEERQEGYREELYERWFRIDHDFWRAWSADQIEVPACFEHPQQRQSSAFSDWLRAQRVLQYYENRISLEEAFYLNNIFMKALSDRVIPLEGVYETLSSLKDHYRLAVVTDGPMIAADKKLSKINCLSFFEGVFTADMFCRMKPQKEFLYKVQEALSNFSPEDYLMVGNSLYSDVGLAKNGGIDSCWFDRGEEEIREGQEPTYRIQSFRQLKKILL